MFPWAPTLERANVFEAATAADDHVPVPACNWKHQQRGSRRSGHVDELSVAA